MSIKDNALLVSLTIGKPQLTKSDAKATKAAEDAVNAKNAGRYRKDLYPKHLVQPIVSVESAARGFMESQTYPWSRGEHLLPTSRFMEFAQRMGEYETQFNQAVTAFLQNFVHVMEEAQRTQGDLFNANDYPDLSELRARFRFSINYSQVTDSKDIRVTLQQAELDMVRAAVENQTKQQMEDLLREPLVRLREVVQRLHDKMSEGDRAVEVRGGKTEIRPPIFRDSLVSNIQDEVDLLSSFADLLGPTYKDLADNVSQVVVDPEALRTSGTLRDDTCKQSKALLDHINGMLAD